MLAKLTSKNQITLPRDVVKEFKGIDFKRIGQVMHQAIMFDGRNFYADQHLDRLGFEYYGIGRG